VTTLAQLEVMVSRDLRDISMNTWTTAEIDDLINQGIDAVSDLAPKEIVQTIGTVSTGLVSYSASSFVQVYRLDVYTSAGSYDGEVPHSIGGADDGWGVHGDIIYLPPNWLPDAGKTLRAWGYGRYIQLSASSSTTDLTSRLIWAVRVFCQAEGFGRLVADRVAFSQWQASPGNSDTTLLAINQAAFTWRRRWAEEQRSIRRMRKL